MFHKYSFRFGSAVNYILYILPHTRTFTFIHWITQNVPDHIVHCYLTYSKLSLWYGSVCHHVCMHVKRYVEARERRGQCAAKDKCLFNWSRGQTALSLWQDHSVFPCSDSDVGDISPVFVFIMYLNYIWLPLWKVRFYANEGVYREKSTHIVKLQQMTNNYWSQ